MSKDSFDPKKYPDLEYLGFVSGENVFNEKGMREIGFLLIGAIVSAAMSDYETASHIFDFRAVPIDRNVVQPDKPLANSDGYFFTCGNVYGPRG